MSFPMTGRVCTSVCTDGKCLSQWQVLGTVSKGVERVLPRGWTKGAWFVVHD